MHFLPPNGSPPDPLWQRPNLQAHLSKLLSNVELLNSLADELEVAAFWQESSSITGTSLLSPSSSAILTTFQDSGSWFQDSVSLAIEAAKRLQVTITAQLTPLEGILDGSAGWQRAAAAARLGKNRRKTARNRKWRNKKRKRVAEAIQKERDRYDIADLEADEWRARQIAKLIAKKKMDKMKEVAETKAKEQRNRLEKEQEMVLIVEKLQELRALRISKLKKQGRFFPEEDNQFMERVQAAVEEEERLAAAAANPSAAATAILNAEESRRASSVSGVPSSPVDIIVKGVDEDEASVLPVQEKVTAENPSGDSTSMQLKGDNDDVKTSQRMPLKAQTGLPAEFHHYYYGSTADMGTLIEVRRAWDAFIIPGGSRIPQHWVEPSAPSDPVWASYLVKPRRKKRKNLVQ